MGLLKNIGFVSLTTVLSIVVLFLLTKLMGAKQVSQMTMFDYVEGITIGSVAAELATDLDAPLNSLTALVISCTKKAEEAPDRSAAQRREAAIKKLPRAQKLKLIGKGERI